MVKRMCLGCEVEDKDIYMFKGNIYNEELDEFVEEVYCNECLANILTEEPELISNVEAI